MKHWKSEMKCGKCNIGHIKYVYKGIHEWRVCNNCDFKTEKKIRYCLENPYKRGKHYG